MWGFAILAPDTQALGRTVLEVSCGPNAVGRYADNFGDEPLNSRVGLFQHPVGRAQILVAEFSGNPGIAPAAFRQGGLDIGRVPVCFCLRRLVLRHVNPLLWE